MVAGGKEKRRGEERKGTSEMLPGCATSNLLFPSRPHLPTIPSYYEFIKD
jgi:hypothetical protein